MKIVFAEEELIQKYQKQEEEEIIKEKKIVEERKIEQETIQKLE